MGESKRRGSLRDTAYSAYTHTITHDGPRARRKVRNALFRPIAQTPFGSVGKLIDVINRWRGFDSRVCFFFQVGDVVLSVLASVSSTNTRVLFPIAVVYMSKSDPHHKMQCVYGYRGFHIRGFQKYDPHCVIPCLSGHFSHMVSK